MPEADSRQTDGALLVAEDRRRGRGTRSNATGRFEREVRSEIDDGWGSLEQLPPFRTEVRDEPARSIITRNDSPDISFDRSINPYRGCEHGCVYCYARPSHTYLGHSAGLDFETKLYAKPNAPALLERELSAPGYRPATIALGSNTDPYQPIERQRRITRAVLEVLANSRHPVGIVTKSALVVRDIDILAPMARDGLVKVAISVTTLDRRLARSMEPRAATPQKRLDAIRALHEAGIPAAVMVAPIVPALNDAEIETILEQARDAGASEAGYVLLRLPLELKTLFREWLATDHPDRAGRVVSLMRSMHGGKDYVAAFGVRQRGTGPYAEQIAQRFRLALKRLGLNQRRQSLRTDLFQPPARPGSQMSLF
jgi:DNA repair photolyase